MSEQNSQMLSNHSEQASRERSERQTPLVQAPSLSATKMLATLARLREAEQAGQP